MDSDTAAWSCAATNTSSGGPEDLDVDELLAAIDADAVAWWDTRAKFMDLVMALPGVLITRIRAFWGDGEFSVTIEHVMQLERMRNQAWERRETMYLFVGDYCTSP